MTYEKMVETTIQRYLNNSASLIDIAEAIYTAIGSCGCRRGLELTDEETCLGGYSYALANRYPQVVQEKEIGRELNKMLYGQFGHASREEILKKYRALRTSDL